jgi:hypothetical protein
MGGEKEREREGERERGRKEGRKVSPLTAKHSDLTMHCT